MDGIYETKKELLGVTEVAEYLGVGPITVYRWCREGRLPCLKVGKHWRIRREAFEEFLRQSEGSTALSRELRSFLNTLPTHVAVVDASGTIVGVNKAWRDFARSNGGIERRVAEGVNYLRVCDTATGDRSEGAAAFAEGMRSVLFGQREEFEMEYPCHSPTEWRWFTGRVTLFPNGGSPRVVVAHENITERKRMEEQLK